MYIYLGFLNNMLYNDCWINCSTIGAEPTVVFLNKFFTLLFCYLKEYVTEHFTRNWQMLDGSVDWWIYFNTFLWKGVTIIFDHSSGRCSSYKIILKSTCKSLYVSSPPALRGSADTVPPTGTLRFFIAPTLLLIFRKRFYGLLWMVFFIGFIYSIHLFSWKCSSQHFRILYYTLCFCILIGPPSPVYLFSCLSVTVRKIFFSFVWIKIATFFKRGVLIILWSFSS